MNLLQKCNIFTKRVAKKYIYGYYIEHQDYSLYINFRKDIIVSYLNPISMQETLNRIYKTAPVMSESKRLDSDPRSRDSKFKGAREISYYRGENFLNLTTSRTDKQARLIRTTVNVGSPDRPKMVTSGMLFFLPEGTSLRIRYNKPGDSLQGVIANFDHMDYAEPYTKNFASIADIRKDKKIMDLIWQVLARRK